MPPHIYNFNNTKFITLGTKMLRLIIVYSYHVNQKWNKKKE